MRGACVYFFFFLVPLMTTQRTWTAPIGPRRVRFPSLHSTCIWMSRMRILFLKEVRRRSTLWTGADDTRTWCRKLAESCSFNRRVCYILEQTWNGVLSTQCERMWCIRTWVDGLTTKVERGPWTRHRNALIGLFVKCIILLMWKIYLIIYNP